MCKRTFGQFSAQAPQNGLNSEWCSHSKVQKRLALMNTQNRKDMDITIGRLFAEGADPETIGSKVSQLTNDLHPMFDRENICVCPPKYDDKKSCWHPDFIAYREANTDDDAAGKLEPTWTHPVDNIVLRPAMQLATLILEHKDTLPFWAAIFNHGYGFDGVNRLRIRHRKRLSPESEKAVLEQLKQAAKRVRFHFNLMDRDPENFFRAEDGGIAGMQEVCHVEEDDHREEWGSDYDCNDDCDSTPEHNGDSKSDSDISDSQIDPDHYRNPTYYAWANGKPTIETGNPSFSHIWINLVHAPGYDSCFDESMTISELRSKIVMTSITLCHELSHALTACYMGENCEPYINDEPVKEIGHSLENYLFGGTVLSDGDMAPLQVFPWPSDLTYEYEPKERGEDGGFPVCHIPERKAWECFLEQSFWDEPQPRDGRFKKLWLRVGLIVPLVDHFKKNKKPDSAPSAKRICLREAVEERQRAYDIRQRYANRRKKKGRWNRRVEKSEERMRVFHEGDGQQTLDKFWAGCTNHYDENVFK